MAHDWKDFSKVFSSKPDCSLDAKQIDAILKQRKDLGGQLFFDRIWTSVGFKQPSKHYPPKSNQELRNLWTTIASHQNMSAEPKLSLLYYIIRSVKIPKHTSTEQAFLRHAALPQKYQILVSGLWEMDHGNFSRAMEYLTHPGISPPTYADEILNVLLSHSKSDSQLAMAFYLTVSPSLDKEETLIRLFDIMVQTNVVEAYNFALKQAEARHKLLFERLIVQVLNESSPDARMDKVILLLSLPFSSLEEDWWEACLLTGPAAECRNAKDTAIMRRIATGRSVSDTGTSSLNRLRGPKLDGINWDDVRTQLKATHGT